MLLILAIICFFVRYNPSPIIVEAFVVDVNIPVINIATDYQHRSHYFCHTNKRRFLLTLSASNNVNNSIEEEEDYTISRNRQQPKKKSYRFGDLTRSALKKVRDDINTETGKSSYKFGDISRLLDTKAKEQVGKFTNKKGYQFGDISKELIRRFREGEYTRDDLLLFIKIVATIGINLQPVTRILPLKVLTELLNLTMEANIAQSVGGKITSTITNEIDARMKEFVTGDRNYQAGDYTKNFLSKWTGEEIANQKQKGEQQRQRATNQVPANYDEDLFDEWDKKLLENRKQQKGLAASKDGDENFRDWDEKFLSSTSNHHDDI